MVWTLWRPTGRLRAQLVDACGCCGCGISWPRPDTTWRGRVRFADDRVQKIVKINGWNRERLLETRGDTVVLNSHDWQLQRFDVWLEDGQRRQVSTNLGDLRASLADVAMEGVTMA